MNKSEAGKKKKEGGRGKGTAFIPYPDLSIQVIASYWFYSVIMLKGKSILPSMYCMKSACPISTALMLCKLLAVHTSISTKKLSSCMEVAESSITLICQLAISEGRYMSIGDLSWPWYFQKLSQMFNTTIWFGQKGSDKNKIYFKIIY